uniref:Histone H2B-like n=1 Tax=Ciona intestinalis TaxID=7719 RepID=F6YAZ4_CIOIN|nr:histone H2B-like [Ciona intestinalis]|eukprot:XP_009862248.1 histone H2B-like [Ciona intestinalis]
MAPTKASSNSKRSTSSGSSGSGGKVKKGHEDFRNYLYKILKEIYHDTGITRQAMDSMNTLMNYLFHIIAEEASSIMKAANRTTMAANDIQSAVRKVLPGELQKHAVSEGTKAVAKFKSFYV